MRLVCLSDTHTYLRTMTEPIPDGDVLIHAGDLTFTGEQHEIEEELDFLAALPHKRKIVVAGNHDFYFDTRFPDGHLFRNWRIKRKMSPYTLLAQMKYMGLTYLQDGSVTFDGIKFYGSPWQPWFYDWAFNFPANVEGIRYQMVIQHDREAARKKWAEIPEDTNVLITHGPPWGILDKAFQDSGDDRCGCPELRQRLGDLDLLRAHVFGHIHEQAGQKIEYVAGNLEGTEIPVHFVNAAICNRNYEPINAPIVVDI
jgi:hypothetical protein